MPTEITPRQAAQALDYTLNYIYALIWDGRLPARRVDGRWLVDAAAVAARRNHTSLSAGERTVGAKGLEYSPAPAPEYAITG